MPNKEGHFFVVEMMEEWKRALEDATHYCHAHPQDMLAGGADVA